MIILDLTPLKLALYEYEQQVVSDLQKTVINGMYAIQKDAKLACPVDTGRLRSSIQTDFKAGHVEIIGEVYTNVEYAPHVNYGTRYQRAQPFFDKAFERNKGKIEQAMSDALGR